MSHRSRGKGHIHLHGSGQRSRYVASQAESIAAILLAEEAERKAEAIRKGKEAKAELLKPRRYVPREGREGKA